MIMAADATGHIAEIRAFNRFYTRAGWGLFDEHYSPTDY
jgi:hypothetical protein